MAVARQAAATAIASPARLARPTICGSDRLCFAKGWMDSAAWRGGAYIARGHAALDASGQASADGYARRGARTRPIARRGARGHSRSSRQHPRTSGRAVGHAVGSGTNAVRAGCPIASPRDGAPTGEKGGAPHISANREENPRIRGQRLTIRDPRSAHAAGTDGLARSR
jgi:hypothetical protein